MANASFTFDDGTGSQVLQCRWPTIAAKFRDWTPVPKYIGERGVALGDRRRYQYIHATSQAASGRLPGIPVSDEQILRAFILWAEGGGTFTVTTNDAEANVYADCQLASDRDGQPIDLDVQLDGVWNEFTVGFVIEHVGDPQQGLRCVYLAIPTTVQSATALSYAWTFTDVDLVVHELNVDDLTYTWTFEDVELTIA